MNKVRIIGLWLMICGCSVLQAQDGGTPSFSLPVVPEMLTTQETRANFVVSHYWDNFEFTDKRYLSHGEMVEQLFVDFINIMPLTDARTAEKAASAMMGKACDGKVLKDMFNDLADKYLYDPNSPMRNEDSYIWMLRVLTDRETDATLKSRHQARLQMLLKNRPGDKATDFTVTLASGKKVSLSEIKTDYTILFFNNPDCEDCQRIKNAMAASKTLTEAVKRKKMTILAVYPDGDIPLWKSASYPSMMINGYDAGMTLLRKGLYDLKAIPTLYLLGKGRTVLLKDTSLEEIEKKMLRHHYNYITSLNLYAPNCL